MTDAAAASLVSHWHSRFDGRLITRENSDYEGSRKIWNGMIDRRPAVIARCVTPKDVRTAVKLAWAERLPISVRGGKTFYFPFVVTDYPWPATERMKLTAHVRLISPDGKIKYEAPEISGAIGSDERTPSLIVLNPVMNITFDATDLPGTYAIEVTITDHVHSVYAKAEEQFQLSVANGRKRGAAKAAVSETNP